MSNVLSWVWLHLFVKLQEPVGTVGLEQSISFRAEYVSVFESGGEKNDREKCRCRPDDEDAERRVSTVRQWVYWVIHRPCHIIFLDAFHDLAFDRHKQKLCVACAERESRFHRVDDVWLQADVYGGLGSVRQGDVGFFLNEAAVVFSWKQTPWCWTRVTVGRRRRFHWSPTCPMFVDFIQLDVEFRWGLFCKFWDCSVKDAEAQTISSQRPRHILVKILNCLADDLVIVLVRHHTVWHGDGDHPFRSQKPCRSLWQEMTRKLFLWGPSVGIKTHLWSPEPWSLKCSGCWIYPTVPVPWCCWRRSFQSLRWYFQPCRKTQTRFSVRWTENSSSALWTTDLNSTMVKVSRPFRVL